SPPRPRSSTARSTSVRNRTCTASARRGVAMTHSIGRREARLAVSRLICAAALCLIFAGMGRAQKPPFYPDKTKLLIWRDAGGKEHVIKSKADWTKRHAHILDNMQLVMGPLPDAKHKVPLDVRYAAEEEKTATYIRKKLTFAVGRNDRVP